MATYSVLKASRLWVNTHDRWFLLTCAVIYEVFLIIKIEIANPAEIVTISKKIPEFEQKKTLKQLKSKLDGVVNLILVAKVNGELVGFKVGYQLTEDTFYSWLGGIIPEYRNCGIATLLLNYQEKWASNSGYKTIKVKSMNRFPTMVNLLFSNGYEVEETGKSVNNSKGKILFSKNLGVTKDINGSSA
ncbi:GNAT family N-acetyltransferase [Pseudoalteromonas mariniglutinosa]|uniref:GNAT family N-acetyltransferase n=1 Tax=Pseudoalteromonas mariniglutinosa TaxID=206042 RepID=UPI0038511B3C